MSDLGTVLVFYSKQGDGLVSIIVNLRDRSSKFQHMSRGLGPSNLFQFLSNPKFVHQLCLYWKKWSANSNRSFEIMVNYKTWGNSLWNFIPLFMIYDFSNVSGSLPSDILVYLVQPPKKSLVILVIPSKKLSYLIIERIFLCGFHRKREKCG